MAESKHAQRPPLRLVVAGSVDDGKSTLVGRLLHDSKAILADQYAAVETASRSRGAEQVDLALLTDGLRAERGQGITIDVAYRYFKTDQRSFILADTPGHVQYTRNTVTGASTADAAVVLVDVRNGASPQTRRHAALLSLLRVRHVVFAVNKMDAVDWSQDRFAEVAGAGTPHRGRCRAARSRRAPGQRPHRRGRSATGPRGVCRPPSAQPARGARHRPGGRRRGVPDAGAVGHPAPHRRAPRLPRARRADRVRTAAGRGCRARHSVGYLLAGDGCRHPHRPRRDRHRRHVGHRPARGRAGHRPGRCPDHRCAHPGHPSPSGHRGLAR